jgi:hypothetical protein
MCLIKITYGQMNVYVCKWSAFLPVTLNACSVAFDVIRSGSQRRASARTGRRIISLFIWISVTESFLCLHVLIPPYSNFVNGWMVRMLFNESVNCTSHLTSDDTRGWSRTVNWQGLGGSGCDLFHGTLGVLVSIVGVLADIRTGHLPNASG